MTKNNEPLFIPKGFIILAEAIQRAGKHRHLEAWTGAESYHHEATDDWEVEHRLRGICITQLAELCTQEYGPDWWLQTDAKRPVDPEGDSIAAAFGLEIGKLQLEDLSEAAVSQSWRQLHQAREAGSRLAEIEAESAIRMLELHRKHQREKVAAQIYEFAAAEAAGQETANPWPSGYRTPDGLLPQWPVEAYRRTAQQQADDLRDFQNHRSRWLDVVGWLQQECEADDIEAIIVEDGSRQSLPTNLWGMNDRATRSMLFVEGFIEFKVGTGFGKAYSHRGPVLINKDELDKALRVGAAMQPASDGITANPLPNSLPSAGPEHPKRRAGRKHHALRDPCIAEIVRLASEPDGLSEYSQADLEKHLQAFCQDTAGDEPGLTTIRDWVRTFTATIKLKGDA